MANVAPDFALLRPICMIYANESARGIFKWITAAGAHRNPTIWHRCGQRNANWSDSTAIRITEKYK